VKCGGSNPAAVQNTEKTALGPRQRVIDERSEPRIAWAYGAGFDRRTEAHVPTAGLQLLESKFVVDDLLKLISVRKSMNDGCR
jgi:hypothetical protein